MEYKEKIEKFILTEVCEELGLKGLGEDDELIDSEIVDSLGILKIMSFLDEEFGVELSDDDIRPEKFATIGAIIGLIKE